MSAEQLAEIQEKFVGSWKVDRSECFEDFLREVGANFVVRKMASLAKPSSEIKVDGEQITISLNAGFMVKQDIFKLGEEIPTEFMGSKSKTTFTFEDGKIVSNAVPLDDKIKHTRATREIIGEEMLLTMYIGDVVCKRYFKRVPQ
ncbi:Fatty acid-binding protein [Mactra antiquata]